MCILLWTLPNCSHPRFKFAFASNRDEFMARSTSRADFWDLDSIIKQANRVETAATGAGAYADDNGDFASPIGVGILSGQDLQPATTKNYIMDEFEVPSVTTTTDEPAKKVKLQLSTDKLPGTWMGISTQGDLVALTNYRETMEYMAQKRPVKLSRGKVCGEYLIHRAVSTPSSSSSSSSAENWIKKRAQGWEDEFEGLNLLVVQNSGAHQVIGGNREGSNLTILNVDTKDASGHGEKKPITAGVSNSIFGRPWSKVETGVKALETTLEKSLDIFGTSPLKSCTFADPHHQQQPYHDVHSEETQELAWLVIQMLTLLRTNTHPLTAEESKDPSSLVMALRRRVFIPRTAFGPSVDMEYGTRSSAVVLFGREQEGVQGQVAVFVEKIWYGPRDETTGVRVEYAPDSTEGMVWWQGQVGQDQKHWRQIQGEELEALVQSARETQARAEATCL
ncbi:hypothetical protein EMPS_08527 [Entomortierella parvispora]|uniref:Uncharacterized protein n=1 Tax=Entomortierella parvispora TaxID=205924 RepID=A0A9P3HGK6_9FUNG|nr:hypothetical protein EMPS_08527 [Entomortierella parvispora]